MTHTCPAGDVCHADPIDDTTELWPAEAFALRGAATGAVFCSCLFVFAATAALAVPLTGLPLPIGAVLYAVAGMFVGGSIGGLLGSLAVNSKYNWNIRTASPEFFQSPRNLQNNFSSPVLY